MAKVAIFLDAEAARAPPLKRLVVPETAGIETDVAAQRAHVAQDGRGHGGSRFVQDAVIAPNVFRVLNCGKRSKSADLNSDTGYHANALHLFDATDIHDIGRGEEPLLHRRYEIGASGKNLDASRVLGKIANSFFDAAWAQELE